jgi:predicted aminopeptidase
VTGRASVLRLIRRLLATAGALLFLAISVGYAVSADVRFVTQAAMEEGRFLVRRRSIEELIADPRTSAARRSRFQEVRDARRFGVDSLGLSVGGTYTTFVDVGRDTLVLVLSASPRDRLVDYTWWFPVVGAVPYHGYFSLAAARAESRHLESTGHDTYLRPAAAFSTLGWFSDPLFSTALSRDTVQLVETVVHEVTHQTLWVPSSVAFNESFAMFVGFRGAERFYRSRGAMEAAQLESARWEDEKRLGSFDTGLAAALDSLYRSEASPEAKQAGRERIFRQARETMAGPLRRELRVYPVDWMLTQPVNNATVVAAMVYHTRLDLFDQVLNAKAGDLRSTVTAIVNAVRRGDGGDPYRVVERLLDSLTRPSDPATAHAGRTPRGDR